MRRMCAVLGISPATLYRSNPPAEDELRLHDLIQRICTEWLTAGYRTVRALLRRRGLQINHKRIRRIMREDHLLGGPRRHRKGQRYTRHGLAPHPNLAASCRPTAINQLWVADLTYVRLRWTWIFVAVVVDAFSRRCIGWALAKFLDTALPLAALQMALRRRRPKAGLIHHSDRGMQYASGEYVAALRAHGIAISMSRAGKPVDNATCERFIKTLKDEEVYLREYDDLADAERHISRFIDDVYNHKRLHSMLGYLTPVEFERQQLALSIVSTDSTAATVTATLSSSKDLTECLT